MGGKQRLQWGHALSSVETRCCTRRQGAWWVGFNGATLFQAWKPCLSKLVHARSGNASMGPRSFKRGNTSRRSRKPPPGRPLQWGHALSSVETAEVPFAPRVHPVLQWGHALSSVETRLVPERHDRLGHASMGPRSFKRGNAPLTARCVQGGWGFNGATLFQAWKLGWRVFRYSPKMLASMGPRSFKRGNRAGAFADSPVGARFNGATLFQAWKPLYALSPSPNIQGFNGATLFQAWKRFLTFVFVSFILSGFNGATLFQAWKPTLSTARIGHFATRFNGATLFQAWKPPPVSGPVIQGYFSAVCESGIL